MNKEKVQNLIAQQRTNLAEVSNLDLNSINNIIENFKNSSDNLEFRKKRLRKGKKCDMIPVEFKQGGGQDEPVWIL